MTESLNESVNYLLEVNEDTNTGAAEEGIAHLHNEIPTKRPLLIFICHTFRESYSVGHKWPRERRILFGTNRAGANSIRTAVFTLF